MEPVQTKWAGTIIFALKKDGALCFCVHHRELRCCHRQGFVPSLKDWWTNWRTWRGSSIFDTWYWNVEEETNWDKNAFNLHYGLYPFRPCAVWAWKYPWDLSTRYECYICNSEMEPQPLLPWWHYCILKIIVGARRTRTSISVYTIRRWKYAKI